MLKRQVDRRSFAAGLACASVAAAAAMSYLLSTSQNVVMAAFTPSSSTPGYRADIAPILEKNCAGCHSTVEHKSGLVVDSYSSLMKGGRHGKVVVPHDAKQSRLMRMIDGELDPQMPLESDPLTAAQIGLLKSWIDAGAAGPNIDEAARPSEATEVPELRPAVKTISPVTAVKFSPDGNILAVGGYREVRLLEAASGKLAATLDGHADAVRSLAFSPDGQMLAAAGGSPQREGEIRIWSVASHQLMRTIEGHKDCIYSVAWSPDGKLLASGSYDRMVKLWDAGSGKEVRNLQDHIDAVFKVAFSPDGKRLASASQDRTVKIWDVATGRRLYTLSDALDGLNSVAFSSTGDRIAAGGYDKTIYVWKLGEDDGHLSQSLIADEDSLLALVWSPNDKTIITSSSDGSIRFRSATTLDPLNVINQQADWVETLDLSADGKWLAAGRYDGSLSVYDTKSSKAVIGPMIVFDSHALSTEGQRKEGAGR